MVSDEDSDSILALLELALALLQGRAVSRYKSGAARYRDATRLS
jgi:hypothetical protein